MSYTRKWTDPWTGKVVITELPEKHRPPEAVVPMRKGLSTDSQRRWMFSPPAEDIQKADQQQADQAHPICFGGLRIGAMFLDALTNKIFIKKDDTHAHKLTDVTYVLNFGPSEKVSMNADGMFVICVYDAPPVTEPAPKIESGLSMLISAQREAEDYDWCAVP